MRYSIIGSNPPPLCVCVHVFLKQNYVSVLGIVMSECMS